VNKNIAHAIIAAEETEPAFWAKHFDCTFDDLRHLNLFYSQKNRGPRRVAQPVRR
jgi:hypothetical protein